MSKFRDRPTAAYLAAVDALKKLPLADRTRAYADAVAPDLVTRADQHVGKKVKGRKSWRALLGQRAQEGDSLPGDDHSEVREGKRIVYVSQPYDLHFGELKEIVSHCIANGLEADIDAKSWYFPGATVRVTYTARESKRPS